VHYTAFRLPALTHYDLWFDLRAEQSPLRYSVLQYVDSLQPLSRYPCRVSHKRFEQCLYSRRPGFDSGCSFSGRRIVKVLEPDGPTVVCRTSCLKLRVRKITASNRVGDTNCLEFCSSPQSLMADRECSESSPIPYGFYLCHLPAEAMSHLPRKMPAFGTSSTHCLIRD
jgi:hypothetical protein